MCCVRDNRSSTWRHSASPGDLNRVRHGFDRSNDLLSLCHHRRYTAWKSAGAPGTARLVSQFSFHHPWLAFVPAAGTPIDLLSQYSLNIADPVVAYSRHRGLRYPFDIHDPLVPPAGSRGGRGFGYLLDTHVEPL